jgi:arsenate reductase (thioredoxin)
VIVVLFACIRNAGRSQMAAALFNRSADPSKARAISAGTEPDSRVHPEVVTAMSELGVDLAGRVPQRLTAELAARAHWLITMSCGDRCPFVPGAHVEDWPLSDPGGRALHEVRAIRDEIAARVNALIDREGWR